MMLKRTLVLLFLALVLVFSLMPLNVLAAEAADTYSLKDWMGTMPDNILLSELNIPGTHDSGTCEILGDYIMTRCQFLQINEQLEHGIRVFDIRLDCSYSDVMATWFDDDYSISYTDLNLQHGPFTCMKSLTSKLYFTDVLNWCNQFLRRHPTETVILKVADECQDSTSGTGKSLVQNALRDFANKYASSANAICYTGKDHAKVPTLGEVRGKIVVLTGYDGTTVTKYEDHSDKTGYEKVYFYLRQCFDNSVCPQKFYDDGRISEPVFRSQYLENRTNHEGEPDIKLVFTSSNALIRGGPEEIALNTLFGVDQGEGHVAVIPWAEKYEFQNGIRYGWIMMDFPTDTLIRHIIESNATSVKQTATLTVNVDWSEAVKSYYADSVCLYRQSRTHAPEPVPETDYQQEERETTRIQASSSVSNTIEKERILRCVFTGLELTDEYGDEWNYTVELNGNVEDSWTSVRTEWISEEGAGPYNTLHNIRENIKVTADSYGDINATLVDETTGKTIDSIPLLWNDQTRSLLSNSFQSWIIRFNQFIPDTEYAIKKVELNGSAYNKSLEGVFETDLSTTEVNELTIYVERKYQVKTKYCTANPGSAVEGTLITVKVLDTDIPEGKRFDHLKIVYGPFSTRLPMRIDRFEFGLTSLAEFTMPKYDVKVEAVLKDIGEAIPHKIDVLFGSPDVEEATENTAITLMAADPYAFTNWEVIYGDITIKNKFSPETSFSMPYEDVMVTAVNKEYHDINVEGGTVSCATSNDQSTGRDIEGAVIQLTAGPAPTWKEFDYWKVNAGDVEIARPYDPITSFIMPNEDVDITAIYAASSEQYRTLVIENINQTSSNLAKIGSQIEIIAEEAPEGKAFDRWRIVNGEVSLSDARDPETTATLKNSDAKIQAVYKDLYIITVEDGTADAASAIGGARITLSNPIVPEGHRFIRWESESGYLNFSNASSPTATFIMPNRNVQIRPVTGGEHAIAVSGGTAGADSAFEGNEVTLKANDAQDGKEFDSWEVTSGNVMLASKYDAETSFIMADDDVTIRATYKDALPPGEYSITVVGGTASKNSAAKGEEITLTAASAPNGKTFEKWEVLPADIAVVNIYSASASFSMSDHDVAFRALYKDAGIPYDDKMDDPDTKSCLFSDINADDWFYEAVIWASEKLVTNGTDETHFSPYEICTRAQTITFLWRAAGQPVVNYAMPFSDVDESAYYAEAVRWAVSTGITKGMSETIFGVNENITREQFVTLVYNYAKMKDDGFIGDWMFPLDFDDASEISNWANEAMRWCVMNGIVQGVGGNKLAPRKTANRAEIVTMLYRYYEI